MRRLGDAYGVEVLWGHSRNGRHVVSRIHELLGVLFKVQLRQPSPKNLTVPHAVVEEVIYVEVWRGLYGTDAATGGMVAMTETTIAAVTATAVVACTTATTVIALTTQSVVIVK